MPPVIGWAAVTGEISVAAVLMFAIVTAWTPPHFWALSINYSKDYERAGIPMLPVVAGPEETKRQILAYTLILVVASVLLSVVGGAGLIYLATALALGSVFVYYAVRLWRDGTAASSSALFRYSIVYLGLLFAAIGIDGLLA
jgi:protoheme IX farnesyltransferase